MLDYTKYGYKVSNLIDTTFVESIEGEVSNAYLSFVDDIELEEQDVEIVNAIKAGLSWLLLAQRSSVNTRSGAKDKLTNESKEVGSFNAIAVVAKGVLNHFEYLAKKYEIDKWWGDINDICGIFFRTNYFYN